MRLHLVTLLFALAGGVFGGSNKPVTQTYTPRTTYNNNNSNTYRAPANQNRPYVAQPRNVQPRPYVTPGSRSTTGVQPRNGIPYGSRSTTGVQPRGVVPSRSTVGRTLSTGPKAQTTTGSQRNQLANSNTNKSNVVRFPSAAQKQNVNNRLARLQTGSSANQNTPKPTNDNNKPTTQARLASLSNHFNDKSGFNDKKSSGSDGVPQRGKIAGGGGGKDGGAGGDPPNFKALKLKTAPGTGKDTDIDISHTRAAAAATVPGASPGANPTKKVGLAGGDGVNSKVNVRKAFKDAHDNTTPSNKQTPPTPNDPSLHPHFP